MPEKFDERFLIVRLGSLGDLVHTLPAIASLRDSFPGARIDWLVERKWAALLDEMGQDYLTIARAKGLRDADVRRRHAVPNALLPAVTLAAPAAAVIARMTRSTMLEALTTDFVRTARAKGLHERVVLWRHVLRNSLIPVIAIVGLQFGGLLAGSVIVESVFARPGIGRLAVQAILQRDFPLVQGIVLVVATSYVLVNIAVDLLYAWADPRIHYR